ncbi:MAG: class II aldolase/adducin family protein [bacterium]
MSYQEFSLVGHLAYSNGLTAGTGGNLSVYRDERVIVTRAGAFLGGLIEADLVEVTLDGAMLTEKGKPSSELKLHLAIYNGTPYRAVFHSHAPNAIAISGGVDRFVPPTKEGAKMLGEIEVLPQTYENVSDVGAVVRALENTPAAILKDHGIVTVAGDLFEAFILAESLEQDCMIEVLRRSMKG